MLALISKLCDHCLSKGGNVGRSGKSETQDGADRSDKRSSNKIASRLTTISFISTKGNVRRYIEYFVFDELMN